MYYFFWVFKGGKWDFHGVFPLIKRFEHAKES